MTMLVLQIRATAGLISIDATHRYGLDDREQRTIEAVGKAVAVTRDRIR
jgi:hypothetical protein